MATVARDGGVVGSLGMPCMAAVRSVVAMLLTPGRYPDVGGEISGLFSGRFFLELNIPFMRRLSFRATGFFDIVINKN